MAESSELLAPVRNKIRYKHYSYSTEKAYVQWIKRFIIFHGKRHPRNMGATEIEQFSPIWRLHATSRPRRKTRR